MGMILDAATCVTLLVAGIIVGLASAFFYIVLELPVRLYDALGAGKRGCVAGSGVALTLGMAGATLASGAGLTLGVSGPALAGGIYALALLLGGVFTGMIAAGLSEILDVLPHTMVTFHLEREERALMVAVLLGKTAGALIAVLLGI